VIWCATLALAWQQLEKKVGNGPLGLEGAEQVADAWSRLPDMGLLPEHYYVAAGLHDAAFEDRLRRELRARFPRAPILDLPSSGPNRFLSYAHLEASIRYEFAFRESEQPLRFRDSQGRVTPVRAFGIREEDEDQGKKSFRGQVRVLFRQGDEFAVDLSRKSRPYQIILARMSRKATLKATWMDLQKRIARSRRKGQPTDLGDGAILLVPDMNWRIEHRFRELEGKRLRRPAAPPGAILDTALQLVQFQMDRRGTALGSAGLLGGDWDGAEKEDFRFDRPYLIVLRRRDVREPFFVMWVDNAELLQPRRQK
jgi:hypothetical protein